VASREKRKAGMDPVFTFSRRRGSWIMTKPLVFHVFLTVDHLDVTKITPNNAYNFMKIKFTRVVSGLSLFPAFSLPVDRLDREQRPPFIYIFSILPVGAQLSLPRC
jgi:hypothetical protein